jgi:hypothetical protein
MLRQALPLIALLAAEISMQPANANTLNQNLPSEASSSGSIAFRDGGQKESRTRAYWLAPPIGSVNKLGAVVLFEPRYGRVQLLAPTIEGKDGSMVCVGSTWNRARTVLTIVYAHGSTIVHINIHMEVTRTSVQVQMDADQPVISSVDFGKWAESLMARAISVPYYSQNVWYSQTISTYLNGWWDWHITHATKLAGTAAQYLPKTDGTLNALHERMQLRISKNIDAVFPEPGNAASPYRATLAGRTVLDIWDSGFSSIRQGLSDLGDYGLTNCVGIIHNWQHQGYDNALPEHFPANPKLGTDTELRAALDQGKDDGCLMAFHENYVDYYPNYPLFTPAAVAMNSNGSQMLSWLNTSTNIQSFSTKPTWMTADAETQSPEIHQAYKTTADYLDVHSGVSPSSHGDMDASTPGAGMLTTWVQSNQALWAYERQTHGGPVLGEGRNHWYYSGLLDGVEAQLGAGSVATNLDSALPLFVDFDLLRIHPLQINHGMGYYERWTQSETPSMTTVQMDAYRMQEIAFGHAPFLSKGSWSDISRAFVEFNLVQPVASRYGTSQVHSIQYRVNGKWVSSSIAAQSSQFSQLQVTYDNGLTIMANASATPLTWNRLTIPQYGWVAKSADLLAYTAQCGSTICDYAQTPTSLFANARNQSDAKIDRGYAAPSVAKVEQGAGHTFAITFNWHLYRTMGTHAQYKAFVHFVRDDQTAKVSAKIAFQGDHQPSISIFHAQPGNTVIDGPIMVTIPTSVPDGQYSIGVGLYDPATGSRLPLSGNNDGSNGYIIGNLTLSKNGTEVSFQPPPPAINDPRLNATSTVVDFGAVQTDGMILIKQEAGRWVLRPYPRDRKFTVLLNTMNFPMPTIVQATGNSNSPVVPGAKGAFWQLQTNGAKEYGWSVKH